MGSLLGDFTLLLVLWQNQSRFIRQTKEVQRCRVASKEFRGREDLGMPETLQEYLKRLQSYLGDRDPLKVQAATLKKIEH